MFKPNINILIVFKILHYLPLSGRNNGHREETQRIEKGLPEELANRRTEVWRSKGKVKHPPPAPSKKGTTPNIFPEGCSPLASHVVAEALA